MNNIFDINYIPRRFKPYGPERLLNSTLFSNLPKILPVDVEEHDNNYTVLADLPGFEDDNISVNIENNTLSVIVERENPEKTEEEENAVRGIVRERFFHKKMERHINLGSRRLDVDNITADLENGVLTVTVPFAEESLPKKIDVKTGKDKEVSELDKSSAKLISSKGGSGKLRTVEILEERAKKDDKEQKGK